RLWSVARGRSVRAGLGSGRSAGMGSLSLRPLGVDRSLGLDLGRRRALGIRSLPLWPLGLSPELLGMGAGTVLRASLLRASPGGMVWRPGMGRQLRIWFWRRLRMVPSGVA